MKTKKPWKSPTFLLKIKGGKIFVSRKIVGACRAFGIDGAGLVDQFLILLFFKNLYL